MEYRIITAGGHFIKTVKEFTEEVNRGLAEGWELSGGVSASETDNHIHLFQAMIRREKDDEISN